MLDLLLYIPHPLRVVATGMCLLIQNRPVHNAIITHQLSPTIELWQNSGTVLFLCLQISFSLSLQLNLWNTAHHAANTSLQAHNWELVVTVDVHKSGFHAGMTEWRIFTENFYERATRNHLCFTFLSIIPGYTYLLLLLWAGWSRGGIPLTCIMRFKEPHHVFHC